MEKTSNDDLQAIIDDNCGSTYGRPFVQALALELQEERKQPKVWKDAPDNAIIAKVHYYKSDKVYADSSMSCHVYTRDLPKSPIREIAEKWAKTPTDTPTEKYIANIIESAINEYKALVK